MTAPAIPAPVTAPVAPVTAPVAAPDANATQIATEMLSGLPATPITLPSAPSGVVPTRAEVLAGIMSRGGSATTAQPETSPDTTVVKIVEAGTVTADEGTVAAAPDGVAAEPVVELDQDTLSEGFDVGTGNAL